ncbi:MAG: serine hydrolase, partial [Bauldia sp.]
VGRDMREMSLSWAQSAGGAISNARDTDRWVRAIFGGKVVPPKQQQEWMSLVSQKTGDPIAELTADDSRGYALGLGKALFGPLGPVWFYQGETLGYRTLYAWFADEDLTITVQTNSHPPDAENKLSDAITAIHEIVAKPAAK